MYETWLNDVWVGDNIIHNYLKNRTEKNPLGWSKEVEEELNNMK